MSSCGSSSPASSATVSTGRVRYLRKRTIGTRYDRRTDKQTDRQTDRQTDKQTDRQIDIQTDITYRQTDIKTYIHTDKQANKTRADIDDDVNIIVRIEQGVHLFGLGHSGRVWGVAGHVDDRSKDGDRWWGRYG
jgi:hypothetical protein